ncbi:MAG: recombination mediator RecR [Candidatus Omnitrophota bacterium]
MNESSPPPGRKTAGPSSIDAVAKQLAKLPGIGPRMAQRLTFALLKRRKEEIDELIAALSRLANQVKKCSLCGNFSDSDPCHVCGDPQRDRATICVIEQPQDLLAIERTGKYSGLYHVLGGALSPIDGVGPEEIGVSRLLKRLDHPVKEVIVATNPTIEGDATAVYLQGVIRPLGVRVTRLARGLPSGSELEYADETTLSMAFSSRLEL